MEQDEAWSTGRRYFNMSEYWQWKKEQQKQNKVTPIRKNA